MVQKGVGGQQKLFEECMALRRYKQTVETDMVMPIVFCFYAKAMAQDLHRNKQRIKTSLNSAGILRERECLSEYGKAPGAREMLLTLIIISE